MRSCRRTTIFFFIKTCISMTPIDSFSLKFDRFQFGLLRNGFVRQMYFWNVFKSHYSKIIHNWWLYLRPNRISGGRPPFTVLLCADVVDDDPFNSMQRLWTRKKRKRRRKNIHEIIHSEHLKRYTPSGPTNGDIVSQQKNFSSVVNSTMCTGLLSIYHVEPRCGDRKSHYNVWLDKFVWLLNSKINVFSACCSVNSNE